MFKNKTILITGGTGSFGKNFTKNLIIKEQVKKIIIYSRDEFKHYEMLQEFSVSQRKKLRFFIGDIRDLPRLKVAFKNVDIVVHAAALKQVEAAEYNPMECVKTNIFGAQNVISASRDENIQKVIALSTDKASDPSNLYGATKLASDKIFIAANNIKGKKKISFSVVRYGNVLNSRGSIVPFFNDLIKLNKPIPLTHKDMTRFWISIEDAVKFVKFCLEEMKGGEIFIPKLPTIKIIDLIKSMSSKNKIKIVGIRPGEKIHELMVPKHSSRDTIEFKKYYLIKPSILFDKKINYEFNSKNEKGRKVKEGFEYSSETNKFVMNQKEIQKFISN